MDDLISRQAAIDALISETTAEGAYGYIDAKSAVYKLRALPSAQLYVPGKNVGEWTDNEISEEE